MPAYSRIMRGRSSAGDGGSENIRPESRDDQSEPLSLEVRRRPYGPLGNNLFVLDPYTRMAFFARTSRRRALDEGLIVYTEKKRRNPAYHIKARVGLETRGRTYDLFEVREKKPDLHLGSLRRMKDSMLAPMKARLLNPDEKEIALFLERHAFSVLGVQFRKPGILMPTRTLDFLVDFDSYGTVTLSPSRGGVFLKAEYDVRPEEARHRKLLLASAILFAFF